MALKYTKLFYFNPIWCTSSQAPRKDTLLNNLSQCLLADRLDTTQPIWAKLDDKNEI
ncbi:MAG: hypothetical protein AAF380_03010 [Bacteroidota bacterium]